MNDFERRELYKKIINEAAKFVKYQINMMSESDDYLNEDDLFFDRQQQLMSPFDPDGMRYSGGGGTRRNKFYEEMQACTEEREVDYVYDKYLQKFFKTQITHPFKCDGLINTETANAKKLKVIFEYKYDLNFKRKTDIAAVLVQVVYYLKKFENSGQPLPNICFIGDKNECFVMHTDALNKYLDEPGDWSSAPSGAKFTNSNLMGKIASDKDINPFVFVIDENFRMQDVIDKIQDLAENVQRHIHITEHNIQSIYEYFCERVLINGDKLNTKDSVALFIGVLTDKNNYYMHPRKRNVLVAQQMNKEFPVKADALESFFSYFTEDYSMAEKRVFAGIADRLIEDTDRRKSGDFWTPTKWVDYAHQRLDETLGDNWRDEFVVWDNCAGTCNLTRDYKFKELYISTLFDSELQMGMKFNKDAVHFQFDFLNDYIPSPNELYDGETKIPDGLLEAFENNKKILFLINPPYASAANFGSSHKEGAAINKTNKEMISDGYGKSAQNLYTQFLYRIEKLKQEYKLNNLYIAIFCPTLFMTGPAFEQFRKYFLNDFEYINGFQFQASHFADVASNWGIGFTIWKSGKSQDKENFEVDICDVNKNSYTGDIETNGKKCLYNIDNLQTLREWAIEPVKKLKTYDVINLSSGIKISGTGIGKNIKDSFGYVYSNSNNINKNAQNVGLFTTAFSGGHGFGINKDNFDRAVTLFSARRLIQANWANWTDEYLAPNTSHPDYEEFVNDSVIFSLFESKSNQSSLRNVEYKDKSWEIKNEFFWMSTQEIMDLADENDNEACYEDAATSKERFVYKYLQNVTLSPEAQAVLDAANELVVDSFQWRQDFAADYPEYQINNWDCGYYQLKGLWSIYMKNEFKQFRDLFNALADKMRPMVYELGFLKK